ncbi:AAA family ATPase [Archangium violaceum]|uniref:Chromosome segregation protein SMC n=1 Tax=Archangium violaceum Cb vi76 TaxID=1406225 RepID=A0A084SHJ4_9BACT|nr:AAA family ATPase [Archangium violaceum]KFA87929.1 chromosome segregation protein SMC [Archangium violaceum Cb vi76]
MIREVSIENFKSIQELNLQLGRVNTFIGANGSGKSNILEAIALQSAAAQNKLDNEFLASRGIRVTEPVFMRAAFAEEGAPRDITISVQIDDGVELKHRLRADETSAYARWQDELTLNFSGPMRHHADEVIRRIVGEMPPDFSPPLRAALERVALSTYSGLPDFIVFSPENSYLRVFQAEGQILPLGIKGEGLFAHLKALNTSSHARLAEVMDKLALIDWFERLDFPAALAPGERSIRIRDRYLAEGALFDQRSANEGFLFLLFYLTLFISPDTPRFFAIDNVDASFNPKLCATLIQELTGLAKKYEKQVILTTHNPAVLDGIDLTDSEQRLFVIARNKDGHTKARRVSPPRPVEGEPPMKLSEAFMRGYIGGLPKNF